MIIIYINRENTDEFLRADHHHFLEICLWQPRKHFLRQPSGSGWAVKPSQSLQDLVGTGKLSCSDNRLYAHRPNHDGEWWFQLLTCVKLFISVKWQIVVCKCFNTSETINVRT